MRHIYRQLLRRPAPADRFVLEDSHAATVGPDPSVALRRIAAETVILQDQAEEALRGIQARESLGLIAPRAGPLVRRFFALRDQLPPVVDEPQVARLRDEMATILHSHAMALNVAMDFLATEWRSVTLSRQIDQLNDLGPPARRMDEICALLTSSARRSYDGG